MEAQQESPESGGSLAGLVQPLQGGGLLPEQVWASEKPTGHADSLEPEVQNFLQNDGLITLSEDGKRLIITNG